MKKDIISSLIEGQTALNNLISDNQSIIDIEYAAQILINTYEHNGTVFSCGNGGSLSDATHFAEELTGRYRKDRKAYAAISINDPTHITCVANDYGYDYIFSRYLEAHGRENDTLIAMSTSGNSQTVINATKEAKSIGMNVIVLSGKKTTKLSDYSDVYICTPAGEFADRVQELHIKVLHILIEMIERHFHPESYLI